jgi:Flp pilus assembly protein TadG
VRVVARARRDERGAVAVFVAICAVMLFGFAAYAIDAGNAWQTRRNIVTASDAAALAAAGEYSTGAASSAGDCADVAAGYLSSNVDGATLLACDPEGIGQDSGYVTVQGQTTANYTFAGIFGIDDSDIDSITTAEWGIPSGVSGLRPFGLCLHANPQLAAWLNLPTGPAGQSAPITITYGKSQPDPCGSNVPGNWGVMDFDGGANSNADTKDWTLNGYPGEITIPSTVHGDTGAFSNSLNSELNALRTSGAFFGLPVFDSATGNGSNARFGVVAVVFVKLIDFVTTGSQADRSLTLVFDRGVLQGRCCGTGIDTGARSLRICDVNTLSPNTSDKTRAC